MNYSKSLHSIINIKEYTNDISLIDAYYKNKLKIKYILLTDGETLLNKTLIKPINSINLRDNLYIVDTLSITKTTSNNFTYLLLIKLANLEVIDISNRKDYLIIKEINIYLKDNKYKDLSINIANNLIKNNINKIKRIINLNNYEKTNNNIYKLTLNR